MMKKLLRFLIGASIAGIVVVTIAYFVTNTLEESRELNDEARQQAPGKFVPLSNGLTHYVELGPSDGEPVLLVHGGGITGMEVWKFNAQFLADHGKRVLMYDLYGRGYTDRLQGEYTPEVMVQQMEEMMDHVKFPDTIDIVSMSMGSMIALEYATLQKRKVRTMVFLDPYATGDYRPNTLLTIPVVSSMLMTFYWYPNAVENQRKEFVNQPLFETYAERLRYFMSFEGYKHTNYSTWMHTLNQPRMELMRQLPPNRVLLLYGANDPYFSRGILDLFNQVYPTLSAAEIPEAGHMPHYEKPEEVNLMLNEFLN